ncbi:pentatricopeptide repeat-containing protein At2g13600 isoform X2 [Cryptomeria japonica]|nr:pentatricopeptide repeat-containing protein At2g13600 isoform X2 [Cryptomeria japonica]
MRNSGVYPDNFTYTFALKACAGLLDIQGGKEIHYWIDRNGIELDVFVGSALVDMYAKCGCMDEAQHVFDKMSHRNVVSWTAMISGYWQNGLASEAIRLFNEMRIAGVILDSVTLMNVLPACAHLAALQQGKVVHGCIIKNNFSGNVSVGTSLLDMYAKCRSFEDAQQLFDKMSERDVILWNAMIVGCAQNGDTDKALRLFHQMQLENVTPNLVTIVSVLPACAHLAALQQGKWMHAYIIRSGFESDVSVGNCLIDMYIKCGSVEVAGQLFERMSQRSVVSWTVMILGYGMHGQVEDALNLFSQMQQTGMKPDHVTFTAVLSACRHAGLLDKGRQYFDSMNQDYCVPPRMEHYACMVDLLGRAGHFDEAQDLMKKMPLQPDNNVLGALLGGCRIHHNVELAEHVSRQLFEIDPKNAGNYVLLSNIYAAAGQWHGVAKIRTLLKERGLKKIPGSSWIEIRNSVHAFLGGELDWADEASGVYA